MEAHIVAKLAPSVAIWSACCSIGSIVRKCGAKPIRQTRRPAGALSRIVAGGVRPSDKAVQIAAQLLDIDRVRNVGAKHKIAVSQSTFDRASGRSGLASGPSK